MEILERVATLEVTVKNVERKLDHIDLCVDDLKKTVWRASGAVAFILVLAQIFIRHA